jgi:SAM-dependent methyltransferase
MRSRTPSSFRAGPLFHARAHPERVASFDFPADLDRRHDVLMRLVGAVERGRIDDVKEEILSGVFGGALGYPTMRRAGVDTWELEAEPGVVVPLVVAPIRQDLDRCVDRALTPVQRAWEYAEHAPACRFILVSNGRETRLYSTARTPDVCETFLTEDLATIDGFKRFYSLLARDRLLGSAPGIPSPVERLLAASARAEAEVTRELHAEHKALREELFTQLRRAHPDLPAREVLGHAQAILDRVLFVAFAEHRDLLPRGTLAGAVAAPRGLVSTPLWHELGRVLRRMDRGRADPQRADPMDRLEVSDALCKELANLARHDFRDEISVEVLGHVFEQSIGARTAAPAKRHDEGVYYTPAHLTRYIVDRTLGRTLTERRRAIFDRLRPEERETEQARIAASIEAWVAYRGALEQVRVLDPACGAGAFLIAAYEALGREYERVAGELAELRGGQIERFDVEETVLGKNLFGVDLSAESVEITRLSLWLEAAQHGRWPADLESNVVQGDSLARDPELSPARWPGGFDVVLGNPPYIRHELFPHLKGRLGGYAVYHGMADIYVYFFERGLSVLAPQGRLGFVVSNKWLRAGYAAPLRALLARRTEIESLIDFGHAPIFEDADTSPCVIALRKLGDEEQPSPQHALSVTAFPRAELAGGAIAGYVASHRYAVPQKRLGEEAWSLEPARVESLLEKIKGAGAALTEYAKAKPYYGIKTGCNEAFIVDSATRDRIVREDPACVGVFKPFLRGQDMGRWSPASSERWMIYAPWDVDIERFPAILAHLRQFRPALEGRAEVKAARFPWYALSRFASDYVGLFSGEKIVYQVIQFHSAYGLDDGGLFLNDKGFFIPTADPWLLAVLNSPLMWWHNWRYLGHMKDEALNPSGVKMEQLPIAAPDDEARRLAEDYVPRLVAFVREDRQARSGVLEALRTQMNVEAPGQKLEAFEALSRDDFLAEVGKRRPKALGKLKPADLRYLREVHDEYAVPILEHRTRALTMERRLSDLVNRAYGLTADEVELLWATAPPRMPVGR